MTDSRQVADQPGAPETETIDLDAKYRDIGISAVAAAARYAGPLRNEDHAPAREPKPTTNQVLLLG